jgi:hypothetical protein
MGAGWQDNVCVEYVDRECENAVLVGVKFP